MGIIKTWNQWYEDFGSGSSSFVQDTGTNIVKTMCSLYSKYPNTLPLVPFARSYMKGFCGDVDEPLSSPQPPPFEGGQCPVQYYIRASCKYEQWSAGTFGGAGVFAQDLYPSFDSRQNYIDIVGAVQSVEFELWDRCAKGDRAPEDCNLGRIKARIKVVDSVGVKYGNCALYRFSPFSNSSTTLGGSGYLRYGTQEQESIALERVDGQADSCGSLPEQYPPDPPVDEDDFSKTVIVNNYNEQGDVIESNEFDLIVPIDLGDAFDATLKLGDITVDVDVGGINIGGDTNTTNNYNKKLPPPRGGGGGGASGEEGIYDEEEKPEEEEAQDVGIERLDYIVIEVTQKPANAPRQDGEPGDDIYFPGFAEFKSGAYNYPRVPLHFERNILPAPDGADGYAVRFYPGYKGKITVYTRKESS